MNIEQLYMSHNVTFLKCFDLHKNYINYLVSFFYVLTNNELRNMYISKKLTKKYLFDSSQLDQDQSTSFSE